MLTPHDGEPLLTSKGTPVPSFGFLRQVSFEPKSHCVAQAWPVTDDPPASASSAGIISECHMPAYQARFLLMRTWVRNRLGPS